MATELLFNRTRSLGRWMTCMPTALPFGMLRRLKVSQFHSKPNKKVAFCVIGDEILSGKTIDTNTNYIAKRCFENGLDLKRVLVIPDDVSDIRTTIKSLTNSFDLVFTSGGIGPTHDDVTYEGIAKAFNDTLEYHEPTKKRLLDSCNQKLAPEKSLTWADLTEDRKRMALLPSSATVLTTPSLWVPLVVLKNVHILPGIPVLFQKITDHFFLEHLSPESRGISYKRAIIYTQELESIIAPVLRMHQNILENIGVKIGSYPKLTEINPATPTNHTKYESSVAISITGQDADVLDKVTKDLFPLVKGLKVEYFGMEPSSQSPMAP